MSAVCGECSQPTPEHLLFRERIEYVNANITKRVHVQTLRLLCIECVEKIWQHHDAPTIRADAWAQRKVERTQGALF